MPVYATEDEEEYKKPGFMAKPQSKLPIKIDENPYILQKNKEILIKNEENIKIAQKPVSNSSNTSVERLNQEINSLTNAYYQEKSRREFLEGQLLEKDQEIQRLREEVQKAGKRPELFEKIKKLKEKLEKSRAETEEIRQFFLQKSEKDDKYIELLKLEIEKQKSVAGSSSIPVKKSGKK